MKKPKQKIVKRMLSLTIELDKWVKKQGKIKPYTTGSQYVRSVLQADLNNYIAGQSASSKAYKK